jgi:hypothetical protein
VATPQDKAFELAQLYNYSRKTHQHAEAASRRWPPGTRQHLYWMRVLIEVEKLIPTSMGGGDWPRYYPVGYIHTRAQAPGAAPGAWPECGQRIKPHPDSH